MDIGYDTATRMLAEIGSIEHFDSAPQLAAFAGLTPQEYESGTSVKGKDRLCKIGNRRLRKALYFPALVPLQRCPQAQVFRERLLAVGKYKIQVVGALTHKLIRVIYRVFKSRKPFDPDKLLPAA
ncbi:MAG: transposase [Cyanobacteria bacterium P01_F01_bin.13]